MNTNVKCAVAAAVGLLIGLLLAALTGRFSRSQGEGNVSKETLYDTIPYYTPIPVDSYITKYDTVKLPALRDTIRDSLIYKDTLIYDSVNVVLPISQKRYEDTTYIAWVSGFKPQLDSIKIFRKTTIIKEKQKRFGVGITGGYGYGKGGFTPFIGMGLYYNVFNF